MLKTDCKPLAERRTWHLKSKRLRSPLSNKVQISPTAINTFPEKYAVWAKVFNHEIIWLYLDLWFSPVNLTRGIQTAALGCFCDPASEFRKSWGMQTSIQRHPGKGDIFICPHLPVSATLDFLLFVELGCCTLIPFHLLFPAWNVLSPRVHMAHFLFSSVSSKWPP